VGKLHIDDEAVRQWDNSIQIVGNLASSVVTQTAVGQYDSGQIGTGLERSWVVKIMRYWNRIIIRHWDN
jgi:hypothetical protein